jgi:hypothetical protein
VRSRIGAGERPVRGPVHPSLDARTLKTSGFPGGRGHLFYFAGHGPALLGSTSQRRPDRIHERVADHHKHPYSSPQTRRRRYFENPQDIKKRKQSTPRKKKGAKPRTAAQALAEKEQAAMNQGQGRRGGSFRGNAGP